MDYGRPITQAFQICWRHRWLWLLGLLAPSSFAYVGYGGNPTVGFPFALEPTPPLPSDAALRAWFERGLVPLLALAGLLVLLSLLYFAFSFVARGAIVYGAGRLAADAPVSLREAWRRGMQCGWRNVGLWLIQIGGVLAISIVVLLLIFFAAVVLNALGAPTGVQIVVGLLGGLLLVLLVVPLAIGWSLVGVFAERAIALDDDRVMLSLRAGFGLLRANLAASAVTWLINAGLQIVISTVLGFVMAAVATPFLLGGIGLYTTGGLTNGLIAYGALGLLLLVAVLWAATGVLNSYLWTYWTLVYLALTGRARPSADAAVEPAIA